MRFARTLPNGLKLVMFPKKTRGGTVVANLNVRFGDEKSLFGKSTVGSMTGALLMRGTKNKTRQQIQDETDRLKAQINVSGSVTGASASTRTLEANLGRFAAVCARTSARALVPRKPNSSRSGSSASPGSRAPKSEPSALASLDLSRHMSARYQRGDVRYTSTIDEEIEDWKKVTLDDVRKFYAQFYGAGEGEIVDRRPVRPGADRETGDGALRRLEEPQPLRAHRQPVRDGRSR